MGESHEPNLDRKEMERYLSGTEVVFALLFGSQARGETTETSDVDVALRFPPEMDDYERFRRRNRIDAELQQYADTFVDVSDVDNLPVPVTHRALRDGIVLVGDEETVRQYRKQIRREYETTAEERERRDEEFIDQLARGET